MIQFQLIFSYSRSLFRDGDALTHSHFDVCVCERASGHLYGSGQATRASAHTLITLCLFGRTRRILCRFRSLIIFPGSEQTIRFYYLQIEHVNLYICDFFSRFTFVSFTCKNKEIHRECLSCAFAIAIGERVHSIFVCFIENECFVCFSLSLGICFSAIADSIDLAIIHKN